MAKKARQSGKAKKNAARKPARRSADLAAALAEAAWAEADAALAEALVEFDALQDAASRREKADATALLGQALARAARRRGLLRVGKAGAVEPFNQARHAPVEPQRRAPKTVRILVPA